MARILKRDQEVQIASSELAIMVLRHAEEHDLTRVELLQALGAIQQSTLKYMLRAERNPEHPDRPAGVDYSDEDEDYSDDYV